MNVLDAVVAPKSQKTTMSAKKTFVALRIIFIFFCAALFICASLVFTKWGSQDSRTRSFMYLDASVLRLLVADEFGLEGALEKAGRQFNQALADFPVFLSGSSASRSGHVDNFLAGTASMIAVALIMAVARRRRVVERNLQSEHQRLSDHSKEVEDLRREFRVERERTTELQQRLINAGKLARAKDAKLEEVNRVCADLVIKTRSQKDQIGTLELKITELTLSLEMLRWSNIKLQAQTAELENEVKRLGLELTAAGRRFNEHITKIYG